MRLFISGGCKNGKSTIAQFTAQKMAAGGKLYYVATMIPKDEEDILRIHRHVEERRGMGFETLEQPKNLIKILDYADRDGVFMLDSVTALLENEMFQGETIDTQCAPRVARELERFCDAVKNAVFVSDYIYSDACDYGDLTEVYRKSLALLDRTLAARCDGVLEICAGNQIWHKGGPLQ